MTHDHGLMLIGVLRPPGHDLLARLLALTRPDVRHRGDRGIDHLVLGVLAVLGGRPRQHIVHDMLRRLATGVLNTGLGFELALTHRRRRHDLPRTLGVISRQPVRVRPRHALRCISPIHIMQQVRRQALKAAPKLGDDTNHPERPKPCAASFEAAAPAHPDQQPGHPDGPNSGSGQSD